MTKKLVRHRNPPQGVIDRFGPVVHNPTHLACPMHMHFPSGLRGVGVSPIYSIVSVSHLPTAIIGGYKAILTETKEMIGSGLLTFLVSVGPVPFEQDRQFRPLRHETDFWFTDDNYLALVALVTAHLTMNKPLREGQVWRHRGGKDYTLVRVPLNARDAALGLAPREGGLPLISQRAFKATSRLAIHLGQGT